MQKEKSCGAVILKKQEDDYKFLLIRQNQGHWCFPKGHVEDGESEIETAKREILEECGIDVTFRDGFRVTTSYSPKVDVMKEVVYFLADYKSGDITLQKEEVQDSIWCKAGEASALITYDNDRNILMKAIEYLKNHDESFEELV